MFDTNLSKLFLKMPIIFNTIFEFVHICSGRFFHNCLNMAFTFNLLSTINYTIFINIRFLFFFLFNFYKMF